MKPDQDWINFKGSLACGDSSSTNNSYIVQAGVTTLTSPCTYKICPCSTNICRIRYDLTTHTLASPVLGTAGSPSLVTNAATGACTTDAFTITSPGNVGSPLICGLNTGQHSKFQLGHLFWCNLTFEITFQWSLIPMARNAKRLTFILEPQLLLLVNGTFMSHSTTVDKRIPLVLLVACNTWLELLALFQASISTLQILLPPLEPILVLPTCRTNTMRFVSGESQVPNFFQ